MLSERAFAEFCQRQQLSSTGTKVIERVRTSDPSRRVKSSWGNVSCRFSSHKMGMTIQAESHSNELAALYLWEHDPRVYEFYDQPEPIKLNYAKANGRKVGVTHTPDYFLIAEDFVGWVECKTEEELERLAAKHPERFQFADGEWCSPPGQAFAAQFGLGYRVRSSNETEWSLVRNLHFLQDYLADHPLQASPEETKLIEGLFAEKADYSLFELLHAHPELSSDAIYQAIADGALYVDLSAVPLSDPVNVMVYRDAVTAECLRNLAVTNSRLPQTNALTFEPGMAFGWRATTWKVTYRTDTHIDIVSTAGELLTLSWVSIDELLARKELVSLSLASSQRSPQALISEKIAQCSTDMLAVAHERLQLLSSRNQNGQVSARTMRRFKQRFREAEATYGNGFVGLIARTKQRGNRKRKICEKVIALMHEVLRKYYFNAKQPCLEIAYGELSLCCEEQGLITPSIKTFSKERRKVYGEHQGKRIREGRKAAYNLEELVWSGTGGFPPHGERPFDIAHIDHTEIDLMFKIGDGDSSIGRAWLSIMIDAYSRVVLAYYISFEPPNYTNCMMLIRQCVQRHQRLPATIVVDGGKEFASQYFEVLLAAFGINKKTRPPHSPRFGSVMERLFGTLNNKLWHNLQGNTKLLRDPRSCSASHDPRRLAVWTLGTLEAQFDRWLEEVYLVSIHTTLQAKPKEIFAAGLADFGARKHARIPFSREFVINCLPGVKKNKLTVQVGYGVKHYGKWYWHGAFRRPEIVGSSVEARYDPFDLSSLYVFIDNTWVRCEARDAYLNEHMDERQLRYMTSVHRQLKRASEVYQKINAKVAAKFYRGLHQEEAALQVGQDPTVSATPLPDVPGAGVTIPPTITENDYPLYGEF